MSKAFKDLDFVSIYIDDVFVHSKDIASHHDHLKQFFERVRRLLLTFGPEKCVIGATEIEVMGHKVSANGLTMTDSRVETIMNWPIPTTKKQLISFLGLCNYDSRFVRKYADLAADLYIATRPNVTFKWTDILQKAFDTLKHEFSADIKLALPDAAKQFDLHCDASGTAISGILSQEGKPVEFISRMLTKSERNYSTIQRECLAIVFACKKLRHYLLGQPFHLFTDHKPLIWLKTQKLEGMLGRWVLSLQDFDFTVHHISGVENILADAVSRQSIAALEIKPIISDDALVRSQTEDIILNAIKVSINNKDASPKLPSHISKYLSKRWEQLYPQLMITNNILYRHFKQSPTQQPCDICIIPDSLQNELIQQCHNPPCSGHLGIEKTLARIMHVGYWPGIRKSVIDYIHNCKSCITIKAIAEKSPYQLITSAATHPGELVTADILKLPPDKGYMGILLFVDSFSKFPVAYKIRSETANALIRHFIHYFTNFGIPQMLLTDQGTNFESQLINEMCRYFGVEKLRTSSYHPETDGQTERMNETIIGMLRHYAANGKWVDYLDVVLMAYRTGKHSLTGETPALLFLGREIRQLPIFEGRPQNLPTEQEFADILDQVDLNKATKAHPDVQPSFNYGDIVLLRRHTKGHKLQPSFDPDWTVLKDFGGCVQVEKNGLQKVVNIRDVAPQFKRGRSVVNHLVE